jgi:hypothetical protein
MSRIEPELQNCNTCGAEARDKRYAPYITRYSEFETSFPSLTLPIATVSVQETWTRYFLTRSYHEHNEFVF